MISNVVVEETAMNIEDVKELADRCSRLAKGADPFTEKHLLGLATKYESWIFEAENGRLSVPRTIPAGRKLANANASPTPTSTATLTIQEYRDR